MNFTGLFFRKVYLFAAGMLLLDVLLGGVIVWALGEGDLSLALLPVKALPVLILLLVVEIHILTRRSNRLVDRATMELLRERYPEGIRYGRAVLVADHLISDEILVLKVLPIKEMEEARLGADGRTLFFRLGGRMDAISMPKAPEQWSGLVEELERLLGYPLRGGRR